MNQRILAPARNRRSAATIAILGALAVALSGCASPSAAGGAADAGGMSDWASSIGTRWEGFVDGNLAPLADTGIAIAAWWLGLAVAARIVTLLPWVRDLRLTRATGHRLRTIGWTLLFVAPIATVLVTVFAKDTLLVWVLVGGGLAWLAVCVLAPGLATRSRIDAHVISPDGSTNGAWSIDALLQMRDLNADDPGHRVDRQDSPDFSEFITVADRSGNGLASVAAWLVQVLFNSSPWLLQVTMVDGASAIATLRRNGVLIGEVHLALDARGFVSAADAAASDQHRKLLALAAAYTAMTMAERYPDVRGFYRATNWRSLGYLGVAQMAENRAERDHYLNRAVEVEPRSLLVEYNRVQAEFEDSRDRVALEQLMDRLEPVVNQAAWVCDTELVFGAPPRDWHEYVLREPVEGGAFRGEPRLMLLRTLVLYMSAARNWAALVDLDSTPDAADDERRARIRRAADRLVRLLDVETAKQSELSRREAVGRMLRASVRRDRPAARDDWDRRVRRDRDHAEVLLRMRARAALCYVIFHEGQPGQESLVAAADPPPDRDADQGAADAVPTPEPVAVGPRLARPPRRPGPTREPVEIVEPWLAETKASGEIEIRYSYACYLARRSRTAQGDVHTRVVKEAARRVEAARLVDQYRDMSAWDPELKLLGTEDLMRALVLRPIGSAWEISRFRHVRGALAGQGILQPDGLAAASGLDTLLESTEMRGDEFGMLLDASTMLRVTEQTDAGGLEPAQRLRAARYLIDDAACSVRCLLVRMQQDAAEVAAEVAGAVFWVPTTDERNRVGQFLSAMCERLAEERAAAEGADGAVTAAVAPAPVE
ncbi:hypothetical protein [Agromyces allii]|uniref:Uncharacterized protein n=1 Tax=Agromyces allii TaxID=393607 RepID=A0ABN2QZN9_9MICO|nr:hypothetical protein [Agromyces allii]